MVRFLFGMIAGVVLLSLAIYALAWYGKMPVAVADPPLPHEREIVSKVLHMRMQRDAVGASPVQPEEANFVAGARIYTERCSICHGLHGKPSALGADMYPTAPQLMETHGTNKVVGVSDDPVGETYWKVYNGIRLTGMPSFKDQLDENAMWQVSLFLAYADKPMPPTALQILRAAAAPPTGKYTQPAPPEQPPLKSVPFPATPQEKDSPE